jgi:hypothetical protein
MLYRRVAGARTDRELETVVEEIEDRYGPMPEEVLNLVEYGRIRILADRLGIEKIDRQGSLVVFTFKGGAGTSPGGPDPARVVRLVREHPDVTLVPPAGLKLDLKWKAKVGGNTRPSGATGPSRALGPSGDIRRSVGPRSPAGGSRLRSGGGTKPGFGSNTQSWWTARATEEEVKPGFSKEAIVRPVKEDPRAEEGVLTRVGRLLSELAGKG